MSAVGPEFYKYIKKLEEGEKFQSVSPQRQLVDFEFNNSTCYQCNGYYGPSFGEPVCVTCHAFLFPDFPSYLPTSYFEKTDDGDSGNDEPSDLNYSADRKANRFCVMPAWFYYRNSLDSETSPEDEASRASNSGPGAGSSNGGSLDGAHGELIELGAPPPPPSLARSLQALSTPRPPDNLAPGLVEQMPSEVLLSIFSYLDDMSLSACACVCTRWWGLVRARMPPSRWAGFTARRWPLFRPMLDNYDWHKKYQSLVESSFCRNCLVQMCVQAQPVGEENAWRRNRLWMELKMLRNDPPEGIAATPLDIKCCHWQAMVLGPVGSPYEGGVFYCPKIKKPMTKEEVMLFINLIDNYPTITSKETNAVNNKLKEEAWCSIHQNQYPMSPPVVRFLTRILHPNVSRHGDVGIDSVHHNWSLALTLSKVLISIQSLLTDPYTAVCMEPEVGEMYAHDRARFDALARRWTWRYAMQDLFY